MILFCTILYTVVNISNVKQYNNKKLYSGAIYTEKMHKIKLNK